jgi:mannose/fructose/N-acetylgalactosamine-specific phosphotransferase system component IID
MAALLDLIRLSALQASWNRRGMQELGWLCAAEAHLGSRDAGAWRRRWLGFRNSNPYFAGLALGAGIRAELDGEPQRVPVLLDALSRQLGAVGDAFIWMGVRPFLAFAAIAAGLLWSPRSVWIAWGLFAVFVAVGLRLWCFRQGLRGADAVLDWIETERLHTAIAWARTLAAASFLAAAAALLVAVGPQWGPLSIALAVGSLSTWRRWPIEFCLVGLLGLCGLLAWT